MEFDFENLKIQGVKFNYYFICRRKLWLFDKGIAMENNSERVLQGKIVHENSYIKAKHKEKLIDDMIMIDILEDEKLREVKITSKMKDVDRMQVLYYLYYLKQLGIEKTGAINYVKERRIEEVILNTIEEENIEKVLIEISKLLKEKYPPKVEKLRYCKKCAYFEFCYVKETD
ncbi:MAG: CRISPR-associated protein Cas4 [Clostridium sp.]|uniref:CRISPR-associated protein Cas4 n=1 Tax=Clostridium sp. TaxID=1506 RepID=UPI0030367758